MLAPDSSVAYADEGTSVFVRRERHEITANDVTGSIIWRMRQSTLLQIPSITFSPACLCTQWIVDSFHGQHDWRTSGKDLSKTCFKLRTKDGYLLPSTRHAKDALMLARTKIFAEQQRSGRAIGICRRCNRSHDLVFLL